jgi:hypothetical protein
MGFGVLCCSRFLLRVDLRFRRKRTARSDMRSSARSQTSDWQIRLPPQKSARCWKIDFGKAAVIVDEIKGWDKKGVDNPRSFHYSAHRQTDKELPDFWRANPPTPNVNPGASSHHWFHYTDVPVVQRKDIATDTRAAANGTQSICSILRPGFAGTSA